MHIHQKKFEQHCFRDAALIVIRINIGMYTTTQHGMKSLSCYLRSKPVMRHNNESEIVKVVSQFPIIVDFWAFSGN
jgi:hypothetical protein